MTHPIFVLVGPTGCGKSSVVAALMRRFPDDLVILKTVTSRPRRPDPEDAANYDFVSADEFERMIAANELIQHVNYAGNHYGNHRASTNAALAGRFGVTALVEHAVNNFRAAGYTVHALQIVPIGGGGREGVERAKADAERAKLGFVCDIQVENRFDLPDGLDRCVDTVVNHLSAFMQGWRNGTHRP
jgi:hypothetical protein